MTKISKNPLPAPLRPDDLLGEQTAVVTVKAVLVDVKAERTRRGTATVVLTVEYPDKGIYLNETSKQYAVEGMKSDESDDWIGKLLPLQVVRSEDARHQQDPTIPKFIHKIWVAPPSDWDKMLKGKRPKAEK